jgi:group I intron endonuclease
MIENILNGKFYIGKTVKTVQERFKQHIRLAKKRTNRKLYDAMNHYGIDKFVVHVMEDNIQSQDLLNEREIYWINKLNAIENGYNMAEGGDGGASIVPEHWDENHHAKFHDYLYNRGGRELISKRMKENNPMRGRKHTGDAKEKMSKAKEKYKEIYREKFKGKNNPMYGYTKEYVEAHKGDEFCDDLSNKWSGRSKYTKEYVEAHKNDSEFCKKLSQIRKEMSERFSGKGNPMYGRNDQCYGARRWNAEVKGKTAEEIYGVERAKQRAEKQSESMKKRWKDENYRKKRLDACREQGKKISERLKDYNKKNAKTCPYCGKTVSPINFIRWHGEKCKNKQN